MMELFGAEIITVPVDRVHDTIEEKLNELSRDGYHPYFIEGGGHGNIGTEAYVQCYGEIKEQEKELGVFFDYIFFASGTGTTHGGLVCGQIMNGDERKVVGISIARKNPRGRDVVLKSIKSYLGEDADMDSVTGIWDSEDRFCDHKEKPVAVGRPGDAGRFQDSGCRNEKGEIVKWQTQ